MQVHANKSKVLCVGEHDKCIIFYDTISRTELSYRGTLRSRCNALLLNVVDDHHVYPTGTLTDLLDD